jgi:hypothetical protein
MPYEGEFANLNSIKNIVQSKRIRELLEKLEIVEAPPLTSLLEDKSLCTLVTTENLPRRNYEPEYVLAIDGSHVEIPADNGFPGAEISYLTAAAALLEIKRLRELDSQRPIDPQLFRETHNADNVEAVLPGRSLIFKGEADARSSFRKNVFELFADKKSFASDGNKTFLDTYHHLLKYKPHSTGRQECPYSWDERCPGKNSYEAQGGKFVCNCERKLPLYSTDALRFHERFSNVDANGGVFGEVMQVLESLFFVNILGSLEYNGHRNILAGKLAVVVDGPLAVFGQPAWLSQAIHKEMMRLNETVHEATGKDMVIIGVEKSGFFVDYFERLCQAADRDQAPFQIKPQTALLPTDQFIRKYIQPNDSSKQFGEATYYGRKFFYRTKTGARIVASVPYFAELHRDLETAKIEQFPRLADVLELLDSIESSRYPNALFPVSLAHSEAAIPLGKGLEILKKLTKDLIQPTSR